MIGRSRALGTVQAQLRLFPVVAIVGARQVGKTTLARELARLHSQVTYFDLENPVDLNRLADPMLSLSPLRGLVVIDEVQRRPDLFPVLRVLVDRRPRTARFLVLGSASGDLLRQGSESLAGRLAFHVLGGLALEEVGLPRLSRLWLRGGFPPAFLARTEATSMQWRAALVQSYLERDVPALGLRLPAPVLRRFWTMLAHYHAQTWNASELARAFAVSHPTVQGYLDVLTATFMVRRLPPWHENLAKRQVKAPKVYIRDSGLLHFLLDIPTSQALERHPKVGASWEGFALECVIHQLGASPQECFFWATHSGAELNLLVVRGERRLGFEFKHTAAPSLTRSMHVAMEDLRLERLVVVHAGEQGFPLGDRVHAVPARCLVTALPSLQASRSRWDAALSTPAQRWDAVLKPRSSADRER
jgi:uncharacterized protein